MSLKTIINNAGNTFLWNYYHFKMYKEISIWKRIRVEFLLWIYEKTNKIIYLMRAEEICRERE